VPAQRAWWGVAVLLPCAALLTWLSATAPVARWAVVGWTAAGLAWAAAVSGPGPTRATARGLAAGLALSYLALLAAPPRFSDDLWRYLFDGRVSAMGLNPFAYAPANPKISWVAPELVAKMNFPEMRTIYPPMGQGLFALLGLVSGGERLWRLFLVVTALVAAWLFSRDAAEPGARAARGWGLATAPLVVVSSGSLGALDVTGLVVVVALLSSAVQRSAARQGFWVGVGAGLKLFPAVLFWTVPASRRLRSGAVAGAVAALVLTAAYLPIAGIGSKALGSLSTYSTAWSFNGGPVRWLALGLEAGLEAGGREGSVEVPVPAGLDDPARRVVDGLPTSKLFLGRNEVARLLATAVGLLVLAVVIALGRRRLSGEGPLMGVCLLAFYASQFTVYPWYGLWLVPAAVQLGGRGWVGGAAVAFAGLLPLALLTPATVIDGGPWQEPAWVAPALWAAAGAAAWLRRDRV
jgi:hypothetical protein